MLGWKREKAMAGMAGAVRGSPFHDTSSSPAQPRLPMNGEVDVSLKPSENPQMTHWIDTTA